MTEATAIPVLPARAALAEGPTWHPDDAVLYWTNLPAGELHRFDPVDGNDVTLHKGGPLGCFALCRDGGFLLGTDNGVSRLRPGVEAVPLQPFLRDDPTRRLNDGKVDPAGRFWVGSARWDMAAGGGGLHRLDGDGSITEVLDDLILPNGLDWSPDGATMYFADSFGGWVDAFAFDAERGLLGERRRLAAFDNDRSAPLGLTVPDGLCVDADGNVWVAVFGLGEVHCYRPDGRLVERVGVAALATTSVTFGGPGLRTLYITTGIGFPDDPGREPDAGAIFAYEPGVAGQPTSFYAGRHLAGAAET